MDEMPHYYLQKLLPYLTDLQMDKTKSIHNFEEIDGILSLRLFKHFYNVDVLRQFCEDYSLLFLPMHQEGHVKFRSNYGIDLFQLYPSANHYVWPRLL